MPNNAAVTGTPDESSISLRPVTPEDDPFLISVYDSTRTDLDIVAWDAGQREAFVTMQFDAQRRDYRARFPDSDHSVILLAGRPVGRMWVAHTATQIRLLDIALLPRYQNIGIGAHLLQSLIVEADRDSKPLRHMVSKTNPDAIRFYERYGFTVIEEISTHFHMERLPQASAR